MSNFCKWWSKDNQGLNFPTNGKELQAWCRLTWEAASAPYKESILSLEKQLAECQRKLKEVRGMNIAQEDAEREWLLDYAKDKFNKSLPCSCLDIIENCESALADPPPETEEVEVKVWTCTSCLMSQGKPGECCGLMQGNIVTITRPKKKLVTRREEMATDKVTHRTLRHYPTTARFYAEWQEEQ